MRKKKIIVAGDFRLIEIKELAKSDKLALQFVPAEVGNEMLAGMHFFKDHPLPCYVIVEKAIADQLHTRELYSLEFRRKK